MHRAITTSLLILIASHAAVASEVVLPEPPLDQRDWQASGELGRLLTAMRSAREATQRVFAPLTAEQLNWRPPNGTHTPRWNAEHLAGRQLLFFSQIYAKLDPDRHRVIDLNPAQMPPDYKPAHPDWAGTEEAAWMEKVGEYVQGHAYLLEGLDLNARAPGSRWKLRALLKQMDRHYDEHTANVVKKFELEGWPKE